MVNMDNQNDPPRSIIAPVLTLVVTIMAIGMAWLWTSMYRLEERMDALWSDKQMIEYKEYVEARLKALDEKIPCDKKRGTRYEQIQPDGKDGRAMQVETLPGQPGGTNRWVGD